MIEPSIGVNPVMPGWPGFVSAFPYGVLSQVTAPVLQPITLSEAKAQCKVELDTEDDLIDSLRLASTGYVERDTERALLTQTWTLYLDAFPWWRAPIVLPKPPTQSVVSLKYYDSDNVLQTWSSSNYTVLLPAGPTAQRAQIVPASGVSWPLLPSFALTQRRPDAVQVQFTCGWTTAALVPYELKAAQKLLIGGWYRNREAGQIVRGSSDVLPFGVDQLLAPFRVTVY